METAWKCLKTLKIELFYDPVSPLLGIYPKRKKTRIRKDTCISIFITVWPTTAKDTEATSVSISRCLDKHTVCVRGCVLGHAPLFAGPWTVAHQAPLSVGLSRQEYWSGLLFLPLGDLPDLGLKTAPPVSQALAGGSLPLSYLERPIYIYTHNGLLLIH